ncbi:MAG: hypothetical protein CL842_03510 [Crocinitomicaceae bacterium]|nr:hypothetical protein [Crocinitomicaceae bacterium]
MGGAGEVKALLVLGTKRQMFLNERLAFLFSMAYNRDATQESAEDKSLTSDLNNNFVRGIQF